MKRQGRPPKLTPEVEAQVLAAIRAGAFAWVAAQAAGIGSTTFYRWMADERPRFREFREKVEVARAQGRMAAEIEVRRTRPEAWLRLGPGREKPGEPGWTDSTQVTITQVDDEALAREIIRRRDARLGRPTQNVEGE